MVAIIISVVVIPSFAFSSYSSQSLRPFLFGCTTSTARPRILNSLRYPQVAAPQHWSSQQNLNLLKHGQTLPLTKPTLVPTCSFFKIKVTQRFTEMIFGGLCSIYVPALYILKASSSECFGETSTLSNDHVMCYSPRQILLVRTYCLKSPKRSRTCKVE